MPIPALAQTEIFSKPGTPELARDITFDARKRIITKAAFQRAAAPQTDLPTLCKSLHYLVFSIRCLGTSWNA
jgi:hypothetical protein